MHGRCCCDLSGRGLLIDERRGKWRGCRRRRCRLVRARQLCRVYWIGNASWSMRRPCLAEPRGAGLPAYLAFPRSALRWRA
jgi:hypothetical protein